MNILSLKYLSILVLHLLILSGGKATNVGGVLEKNGELIVEVILGDGNTPATHVYIEAYGFVRTDGSMKSFILKMSHNGEYKTSLPHGIYDVFISEGTSVPRCRRVFIRPGFTTYWSLKLEIDDVYTNTSTQSP